MRITAAVALHSDGPERQDIAFRRSFNSGLVLRAEAAYGQAGAGKRVAIEHLGGEPELASDLAHFVFIVSTQGLDEAAGIDELLDTRHAVVMGLDDRGFLRAAGFDGVRV